MEDLTMKKLSIKGKERMKATCCSLFCEDCKANDYCHTILGDYSLCESMEQLNEVQENTFYEILFDEDVRDCDFEEKEKEEDNNMDKKDYKYLVFKDSFKIIKTTEKLLAALETLKDNDLIDIDEYKVFDSLEIIEL